MKSKNLIIKAKSRLGMKYIPHGGSELNIGVESGPDAVLSETFLNRIGDYHLVEYVFSLPEEITDEKYYHVVAKEIDELSKNIEPFFKNEQKKLLLTVGGDHSIASSSLLSVIRSSSGKKVGVIMFDSHGDLHLKKTSPTGNYHGMWLRPFWGNYDDPEIQKIIDSSLLSDQLLFIGNLLLEEEEINFLSKNNVKVFSSEKFSESEKQTSFKQILDFCNINDVVHISFDIDVFSTDFVKATGTPNPNGFNTEMIFEIINELKKSNKIFSLDLVEVNPKKDGSVETIALAQEVIERFL